MRPSSCASASTASTRARRSAGDRPGKSSAAARSRSLGEPPSSAVTQRTVLPRRVEVARLRVGFVPDLRPVQPPPGAGIGPEVADRGGHARYSAGVSAGHSRRHVVPAGVAALIVAGVVLSLVAGLRPARAQHVNAQLPWHTVELDARGNLLPWYEPAEGLGYDHVLHLGWRFLERDVPADSRTRRPVYLNFAVFDSRTRQGTYWQHDPAELYASFVDSLLPWYAYSGDRQATGVVRRMLDYQLAHGTTPAGWSWPGVPFATACAGDLDYGRCLAGMPKAYYGGIEPDKVGLLGLG